MKTDLCDSLGGNDRGNELGGSTGTGASHAGARRRDARNRTVHYCSLAARGQCANSLKRLARPAGLEPAASWFVARRSIQLS